MKEIKIFNANWLFIWKKWVDIKEYKYVCIKLVHDCWENWQYALTMLLHCSNSFLRAATKMLPNGPNWRIVKNSSWHFNFLYIFDTHSSSRYENQCQNNGKIVYAISWHYKPTHRDMRTPGILFKQLSCSSNDWFSVSFFQVLYLMSFGIELWWIIEAEGKITSYHKRKRFLQ